MKFSLPYAVLAICVARAVSVEQNAAGGPVTNMPINKAEMPLKADPNVVEKPKIRGSTESPKTTTNLKKNKVITTLFAQPSQAVPKTRFRFARDGIPALSATPQAVPQSSPKTSALVSSVGETGEAPGPTTKGPHTAIGRQNAPKMTPAGCKLVAPLGSNAGTDNPIADPTTNVIEGVPVAVGHGQSSTEGPPITVAGADTHSNAASVPGKVRREISSDLGTDLLSGWINGIVGAIGTGKKAYDDAVAMIRGSKAAPSDRLGTNASSSSHAQTHTKRRYEVIPASPYEKAPFNSAGKNDDTIISHSDKTLMGASPIVTIGLHQGIPAIKSRIVLFRSKAHHDPKDGATGAEAPKEVPPPGSNQSKGPPKDHKTSGNGAVNHPAKPTSGHHPEPIDPTSTSPLNTTNDTPPYSVNATTNDTLPYSVNATTNSTDYY